VTARVAAVALTALLLFPRSVAVGAAAAQSPIESARALLAAWHLEPAQIDRARDLLVTAARERPDPETLVELARVWFLVGDHRSASRDARLAAYERGRDAAKQAVEAVPGSDRAHVWYAINLGRWAETRGFLRALFTLSTVQEEAETVLRLNPDSIEGLTLAGSLAFEVPGLLGGDRAKAEEYFRKALRLDPRRTGVRLQVARLYVATRRWGEARQELRRILDERAPTDLPRWTTREVPDARALLESIRDR